MIVDLHQSLLRILTTIEAEVAGLLLSGHTNKQAARRLGISPRTVEVHRSRIMNKTGARNAMELAVAAISGLPGTRETVLRRRLGSRQTGRDWLVPTTGGGSDAPAATDVSTANPLWPPYELGR